MPGTPGSTACSGGLCPGYNEATVENPDALLCRSDLDDLTNGSMYVHRTQEELVAAGERSVVTDSSTSFAGATFDYSGIDFPLSNMRALSVGRADYGGATLVHPVIACQDAPQARFAGATIHGTSTKDAMTTIYDVDFTQSDFSGSQIWLTAMGLVAFDGSNAQGADWTAVEALRAGNFPYQSDLAIDFTEVDFTDASLGVTANPNTGTSGMKLSVKMGSTGSISDWSKHVDFTGANLSGAHIRDLTGPLALFSAAQTTGLTVDGAGIVDAAVFDAGWLGVNWTGTYTYEGATCPDGSIGSSSNACF